MTSGFEVPSLKPSRLRERPAGRGGLQKASTFHSRLHPAPGVLGDVPKGVGHRVVIGRA